MNNSKKDELINREWERINLELLDEIYADPDLAQRVSSEDMKKDLQEMGIDSETLTALRERILATMGKNIHTISSEVSSTQDNQEKVASPRSPSLNLLPGLKELLAQLHALPAAAEARPALKDYIYWTSGRQVMLAVTVEGDGNCLISVWNSEGEPSAKLDGCSINGLDGTLLTTIVAANAQTNGVSVTEGFCVKDPTGNLLPLHLEP